MTRTEQQDAAEPGARKTGGSDVAWLVGVSSILLLTLLPFSSYATSVPFIKEEWRMSNAQAALVFSAHFAGSALFSPVLVPMTDRVSPGRVMVVGVALLAASNLLFPLLARDFWTGILLRFAAGAGFVGAYIPGIQLVSLRFAERRRGSAVGVFVSSGFAGTTISYVLMGLLLARTPSWRAAYLITALVGLLGVLPALFLARESGAGSSHRARTPGQRRHLDLELLRDRAMALVNVAYALHTAELYLARLWLPLLLGAALIQSGREPQAAAALAATLSGFMFMMGIPGVAVGGFLSDSIGRPAAAALLFTASGACSFVAGWLVSVPPVYLILLGFVYGFVTAADSAIYSTAVTELSPRGQLGSAQAIQSFIGFTLGAIAPVVSGSLLDLVRSPAGWGLAFSFNGALAVAGVLALLWLRRLPQAAQMAQGKRRP